MFQARFAAVAAVFLAGAISFGAIPTGAAPNPDAAAYSNCEKACLACAKACAACHKHCLAMVKSGDKGHAVSAALSADCLDVCTLTAKVISRKGPLTSVVCDACMKACDACGEECGKSPNMAPMAECKKACNACSAACRALIGT